MDLKLRVAQGKNRFIELWQYRIFQYAVIIHLLYFIGSFIIFSFGAEIDFQVYYKVGEVFITDISDLYNPANYFFPFRYFPLCAIFFIPYSLLSYELAFIIFNILNLILNILASVILYKIIFLVRSNTHEKEEKRVITYISLFLIGLPQGSNYVLGQINIYIVVLILISLFIFLKHEETKWQLIASVILGISMIIKPITIFLIPFLIVINYDLKGKKLHFDIKKSLVRIVGMFIPLSLNLIPFLMFPSLLTGFLETNFSGTAPVDINFSFSITKLITNFSSFYNLPYKQLIVFISVVCVVGGLGFMIYLLRRTKQHYMIYGFLLGISIMLLVYFDSWDHHLLILTPLLIIALFNLPRDSEITKKFIKPGFIALNFFNLVFMGVWILTQEFFPYNFVGTIFLLFIIYGIGIYSLKTDRNTRKSDD